jgi:osmotically-inducible protein OsmY
MADRNRWRDDYGRDDDRFSEEPGMRGTRNDWRSSSQAYGRGRDEFGGHAGGQGRWGSQERGYGSEGEYGFESQPSSGWREDEQWRRYGRGGGGGYGGGYGGREGSFGTSRGYGSDDWNRARGTGQDWGGRYGRDQYESSQHGGSSYGGTGGWRGRTGSYGEQRPDWYGGSERYGQYGRDQEYGRRDERGFWDRASDEVSSWFGDEDAERRRRMDKHRGKGPKNYVRSEERIREDVSDRLSDDWRVDASEIEVNVSGSEVTLSGHVIDRDQRRRAEDIAESVSGVTHVQNNIRVQQPGQTDTEGMGTASGTATTSGSKTTQSSAQNRSRTGT